MSRRRPWNRERSQRLLEVVEAPPTRRRRRRLCVPPPGRGLPRVRPGHGPAGWPSRPHGPRLRDQPARAGVAHARPGNRRGRASQDAVQRATRPDRMPAPVLQATGLTRRHILDSVDVEVRAGEVVGLAGLLGAGRSETAKAIYGAQPLDSRVGRGRRQPDTARVPQRGDRGRHRPDPRGSQGRGHRPVTVGPRQHRPGGPSVDVEGWLRVRSAAGRAGRRI